MHIFINTQKLMLPTHFLLRILSLFILINLMLTTSCFARLSPPTLHPILLKGEECREKNQTTMGIQYCYQIEREEWDKELNKIYKKLLDEIQTPNTKEALKNAQRAWMAFRDQELEFLRHYYREREGTIWSIVAGRIIVNIVKDRVKELYETLESVDMAGDSSKNYIFEVPK
jgi:uncharacterized protein YecT (DUF1311 family)